MAIIRSGKEQKIENFKATLGITGDVYIDENNHIASLETHRALMEMYGYPSTATTIEEAEIERAAFEADRAAKLAELQQYELPEED